MVEAANSTLASELGMQLEIVDSRPWSAREGSGGLHTLLDELRRTDSGDDVDLVILCALELGQPLFTSYPRDFEIQDLRCSLAMRAGVGFAATQRECELLMAITRTLHGTAKPASSR